MERPSAAPLGNHQGTVGPQTEALLPPQASLCQDRGVGDGQISRSEAWPQGRCRPGTSGGVLLWQGQGQGQAEQQGLQLVRKWAPASLSLALRHFSAAAASG